MKIIRSFPMDSLAKKSVSSVVPSRSKSLLAMAAVMAALMVPKVGLSEDGGGLQLPDAGGSGSGFSVGHALNGAGESVTPTYTAADNADVGVVDLGSANRSILNWTALGVAQGQELNFTNSDATSATVLNKVTGSNPSFMSGIVSTQRATDNILFVNPNGIYVGGEADFTGVSNLLLSTNETAFAADATNLTVDAHKAEFSTAGGGEVIIMGQSSQELVIGDGGSDTSFTIMSPEGGVNVSRYDTNGSYVGNNATINTGTLTIMAGDSDTNLTTDVGVLIVDTSADNQNVTIHQQGETFDTLALDRVNVGSGTFSLSSNSDVIDNQADGDNEATNAGVNITAASVNIDMADYKSFGRADNVIEITGLSSSTSLTVSDDYYNYDYYGYYGYAGGLHISSDQSLAMQEDLYTYRTDGSGGVSIILTDPNDTFDLNNKIIDTQGTGRDITIKAGDIDLGNDDGSDSGTIRTDGTLTLYDTSGDLTLNAAGHNVGNDLSANELFQIASGADVVISSVGTITIADNGILSMSPDNNGNGVPDYLPNSLTLIADADSDGVGDLVSVGFNKVFASSITLRANSIGTAMDDNAVEVELYGEDGTLNVTTSDDNAYIAVSGSRVGLARINVGTGALNLSSTADIFDAQEDRVIEDVTTSVTDEATGEVTETTEEVMTDNEGMDAGVNITAASVALTLGQDVSFGEFDNVIEITGLSAADSLTVAHIEGAISATSESVEGIEEGEGPLQMGGFHISSDQAMTLQGNLNTTRSDETGGVTILLTDTTTPDVFDLNGQVIQTNDADVDIVIEAGDIDLGNDGAVQGGSLITIGAVVLSDTVGDVTFNGIGDHAGNDLSANELAQIADGADVVIETAGNLTIADNGEYNISNDASSDDLFLFVGGDVVSPTRNKLVAAYVEIVANAVGTAAGAASVQVEVDDILHVTTSDDDAYIEAFGSQLGLGEIDLGTGAFTLSSTVDVFDAWDEGDDGEGDFVNITASALNLRLKATDNDANSVSFGSPDDVIETVGSTTISVMDASDTPAALTATNTIKGVHLTSDQSLTLADDIYTTSNAEGTGVSLLVTDSTKSMDVSGKVINVGSADVIKLQAGDIALAVTSDKVVTAAGGMITLIDTEGGVTLGETNVAAVANGYSDSELESLSDASNLKFVSNGANAGITIHGDYDGAGNWGGNIATRNVTFETTGDLVSATADTVNAKSLIITANKVGTASGDAALNVALDSTGSLTIATSDDDIFINTATELPLGTIDAGMGDITLVSTSGNITSNATALIGNPANLVGDTVSITVATDASIGTLEAPVNVTTSDLLNVTAPGVGDLYISNVDGTILFGLGDTQTLNLGGDAAATADVQFTDTRLGQLVADTVQFRSGPGSTAAVIFDDGGITNHGYNLVVYGGQMTFEAGATIDAGRFSFKDNDVTLFANDAADTAGFVAADANVKITANNLALRAGGAEQNETVFAVNGLNVAVNTLDIQDIEEFGDTGSATITDVSTSGLGLGRINIQSTDGVFTLTSGLNDIYDAQESVYDEETGEWLDDGINITANTINLNLMASGDLEGFGSGGRFGSDSNAIETTGATTISIKDRTGDALTPGSAATTTSGPDGIDGNSDDVVIAAVSANTIGGIHLTTDQNLTLADNIYYDSSGSGVFLMVTDSSKTLDVSGAVISGEYGDITLGGGEIVLNTTGSDKLVPGTSGTLELIDTSSGITLGENSASNVVNGYSQGALESISDTANIMFVSEGTDAGITIHSDYDGEQIWGGNLNSRAIAFETTGTLVSSTANVVKGNFINITAASVGSGTSSDTALKVEAANELTLTINGAENEGEGDSYITSDTALTLGAVSITPNTNYGEGVQTVSFKTVDQDMTASSDIVVNTVSENQTPVHLVFDTGAGVTFINNSTIANKDLNVGSDITILSDKFSSDYRRISTQSNGILTLNPNTSGTTIALGSAADDDTDLELNQNEISYLQYSSYDNNYNPGELVIGSSEGQSAIVTDGILYFDQAQSTTLYGASVTDGTIAKQINVTTYGHDLNLFIGDVSGANDIHTIESDMNDGILTVANQSGTSLNGSLNIHDANRLTTGDIEANTNVTITAETKLIMSPGSKITAGGNVSLEAVLRDVDIGDVEAGGSVRVMAGDDIRQDDAQTMVIAGGGVTLVASQSVGKFDQVWQSSYYDDDGVWQDGYYLDPNPVVVGGMGTELDVRAGKNVHLSSNRITTLTDGMFLDASEEMTDNDINEIVLTGEALEEGSVSKLILSNPDETITLSSLDLSDNALTVPELESGLDPESTVLPVDIEVIANKIQIDGTSVMTGDVTLTASENIYGTGTLTSSEDGYINLVASEIEQADDFTGTTAININTMGPESRLNVAIVAESGMGLEGVVDVDIVNKGDAYITSTGQALRIGGLSASDNTENNPNQIISLASTDSGTETPVMDDVVFHGSTIDLPGTLKVAAQDNLLFDMDGAYIYAASIDFDTTVGNISKVDGLSSINADGNSGGVGEAGQDGGTLSINTGGTGTINLAGVNLSAGGGDAGDSVDADLAGGQGGTITVVAEDGDVLLGSVTASGGYGRSFDYDGYDYNENYVRNVGGTITIQSNTIQGGGTGSLILSGSLTAEGGTQGDITLGSGSSLPLDLPYMRGKDINIKSGNALNYSDEIVYASNNLTLEATKIGSVNAPVHVSVLGSLVLTTTGADSDGDIYILGEDELGVGNITTASDSSQTVQLATRYDDLTLTASSISDELESPTVYTGLENDAIEIDSGNDVIFDMAMTANSFDIQADEDVIVNAALATTGGTAITGDINIYSDYGQLTGTNGSLTTGDAVNEGDALSGDISVDVSQIVEDAVNVTTGSATDSSGGGNATSGSIFLDAYTIGSEEVPFAVTLGSASGGATNTQGEVNMRGNNAYLTSASDLRIGDLEGRNYYSNRYDYDYYYYDDIGVLNVSTTEGKSLTFSAGARYRGIESAHVTVGTSGAGGDITFGTSLEVYTIDANAEDGGVIVNAGLSTSDTINLVGNSVELNDSVSTRSEDYGTINVEADGGDVTVNGELSTWSSIYLTGNNIDLNDSLLTGSEDYSIIELNANPETGWISGAADKTVSARQIEMTGHRIGYDATDDATNEISVELQESSNTLLTLNMGQIDATSMVNLEQRNEAVILEHKGLNTDETTAATNNLVVNFVEQVDLEGVTPSIGNILELTNVHFSSNALDDVVVGTGTNDERLAKLESIIGLDYFSSTNTIARYIAHIINSADSGFSNNGVTFDMTSVALADDSTWSAAEFFAGRNADNTTDFSSSLLSNGNLVSEANTNASKANAKADALAIYSTVDGAEATATDGSDIASAAMKAVDAANARASDSATVGDLGSERDSGNVFLDFFRKLFGG